MTCVDSVSDGNVPASSTITFRPRRASSVAAGDPATRAPTTTTSACSRFPVAAMARSLPVGSLCP